MPSRPKPITSKAKKNPARESSHRPTRSDYGTLHRRLREQVLNDNPFCVRCRQRFSEHAHHVHYPATSVDDYEALCRECHFAEHSTNYLRENSTTDMGNPNEG